MDNQMDVKILDATPKLDGSRTPSTLSPEFCLQSESIHSPLSMDVEELYASYCHLLSTSNSSRPRRKPFLPVISSAPPRRTKSKQRLDASSTTQAYNALVQEQTKLADEYAKQASTRAYNKAVLRLGLRQLSPESVEEQRKRIRFNTLQNEIDIFQEHLDPFIYMSQTPREHEPYSSVYRHVAHVEAIQDLGISIYSLGSVQHAEGDKVVTPTFQSSFFRKIRRRDAAHYIDTDLIPRRPNTKRPTRTKR